MSLNAAPFSFQCPIHILLMVDVLEGRAGDEKECDANHAGHLFHELESKEGTRGLKA